MIKSVKNWLKKKLRKALAIPGLEVSIQKLRNAISDDSKSIYGISYWYEGNLWEPPVQIVLRDLCRPGDVVFDVGANVGGLTTVMSRMVGSRGIVCSFEASPRIIGICQKNIVMSGCSNVQVYNVAVYSKSNETVPIYLGGHLNDSIYSSSDETAAFNVDTLALDDFVDFTKLVPNLIKMDIEGAEFDAIVGMLNTISTARPHLLLETQPSDTRCLDLLRDKGYVAIDLNSYQEIKTPADYPQGVSIRNNLYIHQDRLSETPYSLPFTFVEVKTLTGEDFIATSSSMISLKNPLKLDKGRYIIDLDFAAQGTDNEIMCGVKVQENIIFRYHAYTKLIAESYKDWVIDIMIDITKTCEANVYFEFLNGTSDKTFVIKSARVLRISEFDNFKSAPYM
jgi:FkbM family methyltransferase